MEIITLVFAVSHPNMDPIIISDHVKLVPNVSQRYGDEVVTSKGTKVNGKYGYTRWTHARKVVIREGAIEDEISSLIDYLYAYREFLCDIASSEGSCFVYLNSTDPDHFGFVIPLTTMEKMTQMKICFGLEIFR